MIDFTFGGPCRGRTYGPLTKSESSGVAQVVEDLGNPFSLQWHTQFRSRLTSFQFSALQPVLLFSLTPY